MQESAPFSAETKLLLTIVVPAKRRGIFLYGLSTLLAFVGASTILFLYLIFPLAQLFDFLQDWITQVLCAICILTLIEGPIILILLNIAHAMPASHTIENLTPIERQSTTLLPICFENLPIEQQSTTLLSARFENLTTIEHRPGVHLPLRFESLVSVEHLPTTLLSAPAVSQKQPPVSYLTGTPDHDANNNSRGQQNRARGERR